MNRSAAPKALVLLAAALMLLAAPAFAHSYKAGTVAIGHIWAPPSDGPDAPVYGPLLQNGTAADRLVSASSPLGEAVELAGADGTARAWGDGLELKPGAPVSLASWGDHIVIMGLAQPMKEGDSFPLTLVFATAGSVTVEVIVEKTPGE